MSYMFWNFSSLTSLNLSNSNKNGIKYLSGMFSCLKNNYKIITIDNK